MVAVAVPVVLLPPALVATSPVVTLAVVLVAPPTEVVLVVEVAPPAPVVTLPLVMPPLVPVLEVTLVADVGPAAVLVIPVLEVCVVPPLGPGAGSSELQAMVAKMVAPLTSAKLDRAWKMWGLMRGLMPECASAIASIDSRRFHHVRSLNDRLVDRCALSFPRHGIIAAHWLAGRQGASMEGMLASAGVRRERSFSTMCRARSGG